MNFHFQCFDVYSSSSGIMNMKNIEINFYLIAYDCGARQFAAIRQLVVYSLPTKLREIRWDKNTWVTVYLVQQRGPVSGQRDSRMEYWSNTGERYESAVTRERPISRRSISAGADLTNVLTRLRVPIAASAADARTMPEPDALALSPCLPLFLSFSSNELTQFQGSLKACFEILIRPVRFEFRAASRPSPAHVRNVLTSMDILHAGSVINTLQNTPWPLLTPPG